MKKKLLFFNFDLSGGGAEKVLVNLLNKIDSNKYDITLLLMFPVGQNLKNVNENIKIKYVFRYPIRGISTFLKLFSPNFLYKYCLKGERYDVEIAYIESTPTRILSSRKNELVKKIAWVHCRNIAVPGVFRSRDEMRRCYKQFNQIVFVSEESMQAFIDKTGWRELPCISLPNVIDTETILEKSLDRHVLRLSINRNVLNLCYVGKLEINKGAKRLLNCLFTLYKEGVTNWHLYFLGQGTIERELKEFVEKNGIADMVTFLGYQDNPYQYISLMDLFVSPSYSEGYSTATIEALVLGVPILVTDCGGMKEITENGKYGILVDNTDISLLNGLRDFIINPQMRDQYREKSKLRGEDFDSRKIIRQIENLIDSI